MKAIAITPKKKNSARIINTAKPRIGDKEILIRTLSVGIDGTDKELIRGLYGEAPKNSKHLIIGHESFGKIEEIGKKIKDLRKGDYVVATVRRGDNCPNCKTGEYDMCLYGNYKERGIKGAQGFLAEYYKEEPDYLVKVPPQLKEVGVLLEPLSILEKAIFQAFRIQERMLWQPKTVVVTGTGIVGLLAIILLKSRGFKVIAVDRDNYNRVKTDIFRELGISHFNAKKTPLLSIPQKINRNIDLVIEATGNSSIALQSMHIIGNNGVVCLTSITSGNNIVEICADCLNLELVLGNKVVFGTVNANRKYFEMGIKDMKMIENKYPGILEKLITNKVPFNSFKKGINLLNNKSAIKIVIEFNN